MVVAHFLRVHARADNDLVFAGVGIGFGGVDVLGLGFRAVCTVVFLVVTVVRGLMSIGIGLAVCVLLTGLESLVRLLSLLVCLCVVLVSFVRTMTVGAVSTSAGHVVGTLEAGDGRGDIVAVELALDHGRRTGVEGIVVNHDS